MAGVKTLRFGGAYRGSGTPRYKADKLFVVCQTTIRRELLDEVTAVFAV